MTLDEFLNTYKDRVKAADLAQAINRSEGYVSKLRRFLFVPSLQSILRICEYSKHQISPMDLVNDNQTKVLIQRMCQSNARQQKPHN